MLQFLTRCVPQQNSQKSIMEYYPEIKWQHCHWFIFCFDLCCLFGSTLLEFEDLVTFSLCLLHQDCNNIYLVEMSQVSTEITNRNDSLNALAQKMYPAYQVIITLLCY